MNRCTTCIENLRTLDLTLPVAEKDIKTAYRDMAKVWHPDRFQGDARLAAKAEEQFKRVTSAYQQLLQHLPMHAQQRPTSQTAPSASWQTHASPPPPPPRPEPQHPPTYELTPRDFRILEVMFKYSDGKRFFAGPQIPERLLGKFAQVYHDSTLTVLGFVDISTTGTGRTFLAFTPHRIVHKEVGFSDGVRLINYDSLSWMELKLDNLEIPGDAVTDFFDRLASNLGMGGSNKYILNVKLGKTCISDALDNSGCRHLCCLVRDLKVALQP